MNVLHFVPKALFFYIFVAMKKSLEEVFESVDTSASPKSKWKTIFSYLGPAYLVSVGYMDPGNWATDIAGGSMFNYKLIWILLLSNIMAVVLQSLAARMGIVARTDLAQANRLTYPKKVNYVLWFLAEIAIASTDLAEVIGMAIGLKLLFNIPLIYGVMITVLDTFLLMYLQKLGMRKMEAFIIALISIIGLSFLFQIIMAQPPVGEIMQGFIPTPMNTSALYISIGIIGATVMPHNLYLHSAIIQSRKIKRDDLSIKKALKYSFWDSLIALNLAFFVNAAILVLAASVFYKNGQYEIAGIEQAHQLLAPLLGNKLAPILFAVALIAAGQSSTITGTISGQIVMEGYLNIRLNPILRRLITRLVAIVPAVVVILIAGDNMVDFLLILSQVILSFQLAFAVIPMIFFVSDKKRMGKFVINLRVQILAWLITAIITSLNVSYVTQMLYQTASESEFVLVKIGVILLSIFFVATFIAMFYYPLSGKFNAKKLSYHAENKPIFNVENRVMFNKILVPLDFSEVDEKVMSFALSQCNENTKLYILHIVESPVAGFLGKNLDVDEVAKDKAQLAIYKAKLEENGLSVETILGMRNRVVEIVELIKENDIDLLIMGAHKHKAVKDFLYGETINKVRHNIEVPIMIV